MPLELDALNLAIVGVIGLVAGALGGMLGVGGSVVMIPALTLVLGPSQHLYQAAAMAANVAVSVPAALRHRRAGAVMPTVLKWMLPAAAVCVVVGVALSNLPVFTGTDGGRWLGRLLAVFLVYVIAVNALRLRREWVAARRETAIDRESGETNEPGRAGPDTAENQNASTESVRTTATAHPFAQPSVETNPTPPRCLGVGAAMGLIAGLLGIGGGAVAVPLQQTVLRIPLRNAIANSAAVICVSAAIGAVYKNATLAQHAPSPEVASGGVTLSWVTGVTLAALLAPTAWLGGRLGATLTHTLPIRWVRLAFIALMVVAAIRMAV